MIYMVCLSDEANQASCVNMDTNDHTKWYDVSCTVKSKALCEKDKSDETRPSPQPSVPPGSTCAEGWVGYGDYCYEVLIYT